MQQIRKQWTFQLVLQDLVKPFSFLFKKTSVDDLSYAEQASRAREIERIEEGGFQPAQFKSSAGGGRTQKVRVCVIY